MYVCISTRVGCAAVCVCGLWPFVLSVAAVVQSLIVALMLHDGECVAQRHGTCEDTLMRVLVSRSEVDLKKILEEYSAMYDMSLQEHLQVRVFVSMVPLFIVSGSAGKRTH